MIGPVPLFGQAPFCGDGQSSLFSAPAVKPPWLWSNSEFLITSLPPALVPE